MLFTLLAFAVALGLLITFHELGHYWVARRCGVRVERFSIGFGRVLLRRTDKHGTEWALSAIPLGGYVKMQNQPSGNASPEDIAVSFDYKPLAQRAAIVAAGPMANFILAAVLYAVLNLIGRYEPAPVLAPPPPATAAAHAGLHGGERVAAVNGNPIDSWNQLRWALLDSMTSGGSVVLKTENENGLSRDHTLEFHAQELTPDSADPLDQAGLSLAAPSPIVTQVMDGGAGQQAGLQANDVIVRVGNLDKPTPQALIEEISSHPGHSLPITLLRHGAELSLTITPRSEINDEGVSIGRIGVMLGSDFPMTLIRYGILESTYRGIQRTAGTAWFSLKMMGRMVTGQVSVKNISGPVTIADYAGQTARAGLLAYIGFLALISVSIGVLNLLPVPMLDGGHLMYYAFEAVRGRPLSDKWMEHSQRIGLGLLAALMGLAFFNDFVRLFT